MDERTNGGRLKLKTNRGYNEKIHFNKGKEWTIMELKQIKEDKIHTLTELGEILGRTPNSISFKRTLIKQGKFNLLFK